MPELRSLAEYKKAKQAEHNPPPVEVSGIACPGCDNELEWAERSMFATHPPMRRLNCRWCGFSEVVIA